MKKNYQNFFSVVVLIICAIFTQNSNAQCSGSSKVNNAGAALAQGYNYSFKTETDGNITVTLEILDAISGENPELYLTNGSRAGAGTRSGGANRTYSWVVTGQEAGANIKFDFYIAYASGGVIATPAFNYTVGVNCDDDTQDPVLVKAVVDAVTGNSVVLRLNATDNSPVVNYKVSYTVNNVAKVATISGASGVDKFLIIRGLDPETSYDFTVEVSDAKLNTDDNIPVITGTTSVDTNTPCAGSSILGTGNFSAGYEYTITTDEVTNAVTVTFSLLDTDRNLAVSYLLKNTVVEGNATESAPKYGSTVSNTWTGLNKGEVYKFGVMFQTTTGDLFAKYVTYTVGDVCATTALGTNDVQLSNNDIKLYPNPANKGIVTVDAGALEVSKVEVYSILGAKVLETNKTTIATNGLQAGVYFVKISAEGKSVTKKLIVN